jgi:hypothetical protein
MVPPPNPAVPPPDTPIPADIDEWWQLTRATPPWSGLDPLNTPRQFLECIQWVQPADAAEPGPGWLELPSITVPAKMWEHASWVTAADLTEGILCNTVQPDGFVTDDRSWSAQQRVEAVAQARSDFVALLGPTRRFERLIDRRALLEALGAAAVNT